MREVVVVLITAEFAVVIVATGLLFLRPVPLIIRVAHKRKAQTTKNQRLGLTGLAELRYLAALFGGLIVKMNNF